MEEAIETRCCIAGGGPAGIMLGFLLARAGLDVVVLEKHADFLRDFRGDTLHPSTLEIMHELGLLQELLRRPHQELRELAAEVGSQTIPIGDFSHLPGHCQFLALMPQWDFLDFLKQKAALYSTFHLHMEAEVTELLLDGGRIAGIRARTPHGELRVRAAVTIGADGRRSIVRTRGGLSVREYGSPIDVLWMRISRRPTDPGQTFGHAALGRILVLINREEYWQAALVIAKGEAAKIRAAGLPAFRELIANMEPFLRDRVAELYDWTDVSLLTVVIDRLERWACPGLLCIGDAAHAMSPIGGVGINLAIQDAVAAANVLAPVLMEKTLPSEDDLAAVQQRRDFPARATQRLQLVIQNNIIRKALDDRPSFVLRFLLRLVRWFPILRRIPARIIGIGFRPEHVNTAEALNAVLSAGGARAPAPPVATLHGAGRQS